MLNVSDLTELFSQYQESSNALLMYWVFLGICVVGCGFFVVRRFLYFESMVVSAFLAGFLLFLAGVSGVMIYNVDQERQRVEAQISSSVEDFFTEYREAHGVQVTAVSGGTYQGGLFGSAETYAAQEPEQLVAWVKPLVEAPFTAQPLTVSLVDEKGARTSGWVVATSKGEFIIKK